MIFLANSPTKFENITLEKADPTSLSVISSQKRATGYWQRKIHAALQFKVLGAKLSLKLKTESRVGFVDE